TGCAGSPALPRRRGDIRRMEFSDALIESSVDGILAFDRECRYTVWNPAMERISGVSKQTVLGRCAFEVFPFLKETGEQAYFDAALNGENAVARDRRYVVPETGRAGFFEGHYAPVRDGDGAIIGGLAVIREISDRKQAEETQRLLNEEQAARAEVELARQRFAFLAEASNRLASSLDYAATLEHVARLAIPTLADWCVVDLVE